MKAYSFQCNSFFARFFFLNKVNMDNKTYEEIKYYKLTDEYPSSCSSRSNFKKRAKKFMLNQYGYLMRDGKLVLKKSELKSVWENFHRTHSGVPFFFILRAYIVTKAFCGT